MHELQCPGTTSWARSLCDGLTTEQSQWLLGCATRLVLVHASQYHRRVVDVLSRFPYQLLKFVWTQSDVACDERRASAHRLMTADPKTLDATTLKFRNTYHVDCAHAAATGLLTYRLEIVLGGLKHMLRSDVRESERINKQIKLILERAPSATTDLISSRVALKYYLGAAGAGHGHTRAKWSAYKPVAQKLQNECLAGWDSRTELTSRVDRFSSPTYSVNTIRGASDDDVSQGDRERSEGTFWKLSHDDINTEYVKMTPRVQTGGCKHAWAVCYNMQLSKKIQEMWSQQQPATETMVDSHCLDRVCLDLPIICFGSRKPTETRSSFNAYMAVEKVRTCYQMVACSFMTQTKTLKVITPLTFKSSTDLIASHYDDVKNGNVVGVFAVRLATLGDPNTCSLTTGSTAGIQKILQLKRASQTMEAKLEGLSTHIAGTGPESGVRVPSNTSSKSLPASSSSSSSTTAPVWDSDAAEADSDLADGLNLLLKQEMAKQQAMQHQQNAKQPSPNVTTAGPRPGGAEAAEAHALLVSALSDFHHVPDDTELEEHMFADETSAHIGEDIVSKLEESLFNRTVDGGRCQPDPSSVDEYISAGLDLEEAVREVVLNSEDALGNMEPNKIDDVDATDVAVDAASISNPGNASTDGPHTDGEDNSEPPGHLTKLVYVSFIV